MSKQEQADFDFLVNQKLIIKHRSNSSFLSSSQTTRYIIELRLYIYVDLRKYNHLFNTSLSFN